MVESESDMDEFIALRERRSSEERGNDESNDDGCGSAGECLDCMSELIVSFHVVFQNYNAHKFFFFTHSFRETNGENHACCFGF